MPFEIDQICAHYIFPSMKYILDTGSRETEDLLITRNEFLVIILFPFFLSGRFLRDGLTDFLETFREDVV